MFETDTAARGDYGLVSIGVRALFLLRIGAAVSLWEDQVYRLVLIDLLVVSVVDSDLLRLALDAGCVLNRLAEVLLLHLQLRLNLEQGPRVLLDFA